jgi:cell division protein FtsQ
MPPTEGDERRPHRLVLFAAVAMILSSGVLWLWDEAGEGPLFPLRAVTLGGELEHVTEADLRQAMAPHLQGGLLSLDVARIRTAVESLPWVKRASVRRLWPHSLAIDIEEQRPLARWGDDALVGAGGEVFRPQMLPEGLPGLAGPESRRGDVVQLYRALLEPLAARDLEVEALRVDARGSWTLRLTGDLVVEIGTHELESRLARFLGALPELRRGADQQPSRVDLRYPNGFAVDWRSSKDMRKQNRNRKAQ